jgi:hypothetical protein
MKKIKIEKIKAKDLYKFTCQTLSRAKASDVVPITKHRALSHTNNPCADENDIALLVAYIEDKCAGYLGIMPGLLRIGDRFSKVHWFSTWYVPPEFRASSVGGMLIVNALSLKYDIIITGINRAAERVFRNLGLHELTPVEYYVIDINRINPLILILRLSQKILSKIEIKSGITNVFRTPERIFSPLIRKILYNILYSHYKEYIEEICYKEVDKINKDSIGQVGYNATATEFYRGIDIINWMLRYKWILEPDQAEVSNLNYNFGNIQDVFKFITLKIYSSNGKNYKGFLVLSISSKNSETVLKVLDFHFSNQTDYKYVLSLALKYARAYPADYIKFPKSLSVYIKGGILTKFLLRKKNRIYFYHPKDRNSPLAISAKDINLNYCDGDTAFT